MDTPTMELVLKGAAAVFVGVMASYIAILLFKSTRPGFRGEHLRVVDTIALTQTAQLNLVELVGGDVYLLAVDKDRTSLLDKVTSPAVIEKVKFPRGRPAAAPTK